MNTPTRILGIAGSLRRASYNPSALRAAVQLAPEGSTIEIFELNGIPGFGEDQEKNPPEKVVELNTLPERVKQKYESLPTIVNIFRMLGYSPGTFVEIIDLTNAIFKNLILSDYHKELLVLQVAAHEGNAYEWEQHVSISQAAGVREDQFIAIAEQRFDDGEAFVLCERVLLNFGKIILEQGKAPGVVFKHTLEHFTIQELSDAMIVIGYYQLLSIFILTFNIPIDAQEDGNWVKG